MGHVAMLMWDGTLDNAKAGRKLFADFRRGKDLAVSNGEVHATIARSRGIYNRL